MRVNISKTNKLLSLSSKLIPALILSLAILSFAGGRASASTQTVNATLTSKPAGTVDVWCDYMEANQSLCPSGGTGFSAADHSSITNAEIATGFVNTGGEGNIIYIASTIGSGISIDNQEVCSSVKFTNLNLRTEFTYPDDPDTGYIVYASLDGGSSFANLTMNEGVSTGLTSYFPSASNFAARGLGETTHTGAIDVDISLGNLTSDQLSNILYYIGFGAGSDPAATTTATLTYDDSSCTTPTDPTPVGTTTTTTATTPYCPAPGDTSQLLTPEGDCDGDGITNQEEGYDPDGDGSPGPNSTDTDKDGTPDYLDTDSDNDAIPDKQEGTKDTNHNGIPDFRDPSKKMLAETGNNLSLIPVLSVASLVLSGLALSLKRY